MTILTIFLFLIDLNFMVFYIAWKFTEDGCYLYSIWQLSGFIAYFIITFLTSVFILWFLIAMSFVTWSTQPEEERDGKISFMDR